MIFKICNLFSKFTSLRVNFHNKLMLVLWGVRLISLNGQENFETLNTALFLSNYAYLKRDPSEANFWCFLLLLFCFCLLVFTGEKPDPDQTFKLTSIQNFSSCLPNTCTTLVSNHSLSHRQPETVLTETPQDTIVSVSFSCSEYSETQQNDGN